MEILNPSNSFSWHVRHDYTKPQKVPQQYQWQSHMVAEIDDVDWSQLQLSHSSKWVELTTYINSWDLELWKHCSSTPIEQTGITLGKANQEKKMGAQQTSKHEILLLPQLSDITSFKDTAFLINTWLRNKAEHFKPAIGIIRRERIFSSSICKSGLRWPHNMKMILPQLGKGVGSDQETPSPQFVEAG